MQSPIIASICFVRYSSVTTHVLLLREDQTRRLFRLAFSGSGAILQSIMGDKSPKATNKKAAQKQAKANTNMQKKNDSIAAKQVVKERK